MGGASGAGGAAGASAGAGGASAGVGGASGGAAGSAGAAAASGGAGNAALTGPRGLATFTDLGATVEVSIAMTACLSGENYQVHIHDGSSCADAMSQGAHWDPPRGEDIPDIACMNSIGSVIYHRAADDAKPWTVGPPEESNVIGHVIVIHDPDDPMKRVACGEIEAPP